MLSEKELMKMSEEEIIRYIVSLSGYNDIFLIANQLAMQMEQIQAQTTP